MLSLNLQGKKGFTLFTALVGFIVIGICVLVLQHLSNSEANYNQIFITIQSQTEINTLKDILRLDSYSYVGLVLVKQISDYFNDREYTLNIQKTWSDQAQTFEKEKFIGGASSPIVNFFSNAYATQMQNFTGDYKLSYKFFIYDPILIKNSNTDLFNPDLVPNTPLAETTKVLFYSLDAYVNSHPQNKNLKLLEIVNCDEVGETAFAGFCENGTFYIPIDLSMLGLNFGDYENILRIMIYRYIDKASLDDAILPKNKIKLYVPLRVFGAMSSYLETVKQFEAGLYDKWKFADLYMGNCKQDCFDGYTAMKYMAQSSDHKDKDLVRPILDNLFKFYDYQNPQPHKLFEEKIKEAVCENLEQEFTSVAKENNLDLNFDIDSCKFELKFGDTEFNKSIAINNDKTGSVPCNYLDSVRITFKIIDSDALFTFGKPIAYLFSVELDNREYIKTKNLPADFACNYVPESSEVLVLQQN